MKDLPFGFDVPEESPGFLLWQVTTDWQRLVKKVLEPYGISHSQFVIMAILLWLNSYERDVTQIDIVRMSKLDKMTVSKSLRKLVELDLAVRYENKEDTRAKSVELSEQGVRLIRKLVPLVEAVDADFFGVLGKSEEKGLISLLSQLVKASGY